MQKTEQIRVLKLLMERLDQGVNVDAGGLLHNPSSVYVDPDLAVGEWNEFFKGYPQVIGMTGDLPEPGSFITRNDFGVPVLATRDKDGKFHAFANVCRHRGVVVEQEGRGKKSKFSCPFHSWTYSNQGDLIAIPKEEQFGTVDKDCLGLIELPAIEQHGFLWVQPDKTGSLDVDDQLGAELSDELASWGFDQYVATGEETYETPMNWKLAIDTFGETYHFSTLHKDSLAPLYHGNVQCYDTYKRNHRMTLCTRGIDELRNYPEEKWQVNMGAQPVYYLFPNVQVSASTGNMILVRIYPDGENPNKSLSRVNFYTNPKALETHSKEVLEFERNFFAQIIRDEDYWVAAQSHIGAQAAVQDHVIFGRNEPALHHYHQTYRDALGLEPLELIEA